jgi:DHA2 family multidrug resistance protein
LIAGYTPFLAGQVLSVQTCGTFISVMIAGRLFHRFDPRLLVFFGCIVGGIGAWDMTNFNPLTGFWEIARPGFLRGLGSGFIFIPLTTLALGSVPRERMGAASGLFNMVRTLGGGIGIALLVAFLSRGAQMHQSYLVSRIHNYNPELWRRSAVVGATVIPNLAEGTPGKPFLSLVYGDVQRQALLMAFVDDFRLIAILFFLLSPLVFFMRRPQTPGASAGTH